MTRIALVLGFLPAVGVAAGIGAQAPAFEAASVKRNVSGDVRVRFETPPGRLNAVNVPLRFAIRQAYRIPESRIVGAPAWSETDRFDIAGTATTGEPANADAIRQMLRTLLADRFGLVLHNETREMPIYMLRLASSQANLGPHLRRSSTDCTGRRSATAVGGRVQCGMLLSQGPASASLRGGGVAFPEFVRFLGDFLDRPLVDETGMTESYDLELEFAAERSALPGAAVPGGLTAAGRETDVPTVFTAVREQLGLTIDARRGRADVLVIDRASRPALD